MVIICGMRDSVDLLVVAMNEGTFYINSIITMFFLLILYGELTFGEFTDSMVVAMCQPGATNIEALWASFELHPLIDFAYSPYKWRGNT